MLCTLAAAAGFGLEPVDEVGFGLDSSHLATSVNPLIVAIEPELAVTRSIATMIPIGELLSPHPLF